MRRAGKGVEVMYSGSNERTERISLHASNWGSCAHWRAVELGPHQRGMVGADGSFEEQERGTRCIQCYCKQWLEEVAKLLNLITCVEFKVERNWHSKMEFVTKNDLPSWPQSIRFFIHLLPTNPKRKS